VLASKVIGIGDATPKKKKTPTEAGYAQDQAGENILAGSQGIEPDVSSGQSRPEEAGYAQDRPAIAGSRQGIGPDVSSGQSRPEEAGYAQELSGDSSSKPQGIGPDVSSNQGEVLDNTNVESVQLQRGIMTRDLFAKTGHDVHGWMN